MASHALPATTAAPRWVAMRSTRWPRVGRPARAFEKCAALRIPLAEALEARHLFPHLEEVEVVVADWADAEACEAVRVSYRPASVTFVWESGAGAP